MVARYSAGSGRGHSPEDAMRELWAEVNKEVEQGYEPVGGVTIYKDDEDRVGLGQYVAVQSLWKPVPENRDVEHFYSVEMYHASDPFAAIEDVTNKVTRNLNSPGGGWELVGSMSLMSYQEPNEDEPNRFIAMQIMRTVIRR